MNDYELVTILHPEIKDEDVNDAVDRLNQFVTGRGGEVRDVDQWGRRRLAYPIARQMEGTYVVSHLLLQPANAAELEANLRISEDVLRHLLVRFSPAERAAALAAMQRRRPRPAFDEGGAPAPAPAEAATGEATIAAAAPETETAPAAEVPTGEVKTAAATPETTIAPDTEAAGSEAAPSAPATAAVETPAEPAEATEPAEVAAPAEPEAEAANPPSEESTEAGA